MTGQDVTYSYDSVATGNKGKGRLTGVSDAAGTSAFTYDEQGRMTKDVETVQGRAYTVLYGYDANGRVTQVTYPSGRIVTIARGADGLASGVTTQPSSGGAVSNLATGVGWRPFGGPLSDLTYGNGLVLARSYDKNGWLTNTQLVTPLGVRLVDLGFARDASGRLTRMQDNTDTASERSVNYGYATSGRLAADNGNEIQWAESFTYDAAGNRTSRTSVPVGFLPVTETLTMSPTSNRLATLSISGTTKRTFGYRAGGDLASDAYAGGSTFTYGYDARKRLSSMAKDGVTAGTYGYDGFGRRVWRNVVGGAASQFVYDQDGHLLAEHDAATGNVVREYVWLGDEPLAEVDSSSGTAQTYFIHTGAMGEPLAMTDASGAIVWAYRVAAYGTTQQVSPPLATLDLRLPGQWLQGEADDLHQSGFRDYDPTLGRYVEADPLGIDAGQNVYAYVDGRPTEFSDPLGLQAIPMPGPPLPIGPLLSPQESQELANQITSFTKSLARGCDCLTLHARIKATRDELARRYSQYAEDKFGLQMFGRNSRNGHIEQIEGKQRQLRRLLQEADTKGCVGYQPDAWYWATRPPPILF